MMIARDFSASTPVSPTTAAIAPNAPTGAAHMIMARMRKTRRWMWPMPRMTGPPAEPMAWSAKPASRAMSRVWRTSPSVKADTMVVGMMPSRKSTVDSLARDAGRLGEVEAGAGLQEVADDQADRQGDGRHHQEVAEGQTTDGADLGGLPYGADPEHDRAEDDRRDHHLDEVDEACADRLQLHGEVRNHQAHRDAQHHGGDHGQVEIVGAVPSCGLLCHGGLLGYAAAPRPWGPR